MSAADIALGGMGVFCAPKTQYMAQLCIVDDAETVVFQETRPFESGAGHTFTFLFEGRAVLQQNRWYAFMLQLKCKAGALSATKLVWQ